jgi:hypothetical protein
MADRIRPVSKSDEYRANAEECQKMARLATNPSEKVTWLEMAADWLRMIPKAKRSTSEKFDDRTRAATTGQERSDAEH